MKSPDPFLGLPPGTRCSRDEDDVRQLFHDLGLNDEKLSDLHDVEGVEW